MTVVAEAAPHGVPARRTASGACVSYGRVNEIQRVRILSAMIEACADLGAANVTVSSVVERSGVSRRTFYELFKGCEDCLLAAFEDALSRLSHEVAGAYDRESAWGDRIRAGLLALLEFLEGEPSMGRLMVVEAPAAGSRILRRRQEAIARAVSAIDDGREAGSDEASDAPKLVAEGIVGGVLSVLQSRILEPDGRPLLELLGPLMSLIVLPYLGAGAAQRELKRRAPSPPQRRSAETGNPLRGVEMRLTYRTICVLGAVSGEPGSSNREVGLASGIADQGQISKLLTRLARLGLVENVGAGRARGTPNEWVLTTRGAEVHCMIGASTRGGECRWF